MPQASEALRRKWGGELGVGEDKACDFLKARGFRLSYGWNWVRDTPPNVMEGEAMDFLFHEWDWGTYVTPEEDAKNRDRCSGLQSG